MTDTDRVLFFCEPNDIYEDMKSAIGYLDRSDYPGARMLHGERNKKSAGQNEG